MQFHWISVNTCLLLPEVLRYQNNNNANYDVFQYNTTGQIKVYWKEWTKYNVCDKIMRPTAQLIYHIYKSLSFAHKINTILMVHSCPFNLAPAIQCRNSLFYSAWQPMQWASDKRPDHQRMPLIIIVERPPDIAAEGVCVPTDEAGFKVQSFCVL